jgi:signal transduction histidine kinase
MPHRKLPVDVKLAALLGALFLVSALAQRVLIRWALAPYATELRAIGLIEEHSTLAVGAVRERMLVAIGAPLAACALGTALLLGALARSRHRPLVRAMREVSKGALDTELPEQLDPDFAEVRESFDTMRRALSEALGKLAAVDTQRRRLFADLAHELANPTSAIVGLVDTLGTPSLCEDPQVRARLLGSLEGEALRLARLVADVRDLAELEDPDVPCVREPLDLGSVVAEAASRFGLLEGAPLDVATEPAPILADGSRVEQVLANLVTNARRHTPKDGTVRVRVTSSETSATLVVEDSGPGVPDELLARLGERLLRLDPSRDRRTGGTGLGLSIVRSIAARHDATLTFDRGDLGGLRVTLVFARDAGHDVG